jgi:cytochrome b
VNPGLPARAPWDFPTRAFHWSLVLLVVFSFTTGKVGGAWLEWHMRSGYAILALLLFRIAWGFAGSENARFASFVRGPRAAIAHGRAVLRGSRAYPPGHNPLGAWMVLALLAALLLQAATGLFANDESAHEGPLAASVSNAVVDRMSEIHSFNEWVVVGAAAVHVAAIAFYQWRLKIDLIRPMVFGPTPLPETARAAAWLAAAALAVYALVVLFPR